MALIALAQRWMQVPTAPQPMELAIGFRRALQAEAAFVGRRRRSTRIRALYPLYCHSLGISRPPPYKDFAKELAKLMPRSVMDTRPGGRKTVTVYTVPDPAAVAEVTPLKRA